jgi:arylformamidase
MTWIDISVPLRTGMAHWPDNPDVRIDLIKDLAKGDSASVSKLSMGSHTGTHMDAPAHFIQGAAGIDAMPFSATVGKARVIEFRGRSIEPEELRRHRIRRGERILFKTSNSRRCWKTDRFIEDYVYVSRAGAEFLAERKVRVVGIDYLSIAGFGREPVETHRALLAAGVWIIEGLDLSRVTPGAYELICLPLKVAGGDGAPARAILRS